jgi:hypothetical protein
MIYRRSKLPGFGEYLVGGRLQFNKDWRQAVLTLQYEIRFPNQVAFVQRMFIEAATMLRKQKFFVFMNKSVNLID